MGYTHYWRREDTTIDPEVWTGFATEVTAIINDAIRHDIAIAGPLGDGDAQIDTELVAFNGRSPDDYESFVITRAAQGRTFGFCKTEHRMYDPVVLAVMAAAEAHLGFTLESDGGETALNAGRIVRKAFEAARTVK